MLEFVNSGKKNVDIGVTGIQLNGFKSAVLRLRDAAEGKLHEAHTVFADGGIGSDE